MYYLYCDKLVNDSQLHVHHSCSGKSTDKKNAIVMQVIDA